MYVYLYDVSFINIVIIILLLLWKVEYEFKKYVCVNWFLMKNECNWKIKWWKRLVIMEISFIFYGFLMNLLLLNKEKCIVI